MEDKLSQKAGKEQLLRRTTRCLDENRINIKPKNLSEPGGDKATSSESHTKKN